LQVRPDPRFIRDGDDLVTVLDVPAPQAALGGTLRAPSLLDGDVEVELPAGTQPGATITLRGRGMPVLRRPGRHGDLRVVANVVIPRRLTREQRALLEQLSTSITPENLAGDEGMVSKLKRLFHA
jgi:molecular chaperone DnaJ